MPEAAWSLVAGTVGTWVLTIRDEGRNAVVDLFESGDEITASVWSGDAQEPLFDPVVTWLVPEDGTFTLTITSFMTTGLEPGTYSLQVFATPASDAERRCVFSGGLRLLPTPGLDEPLPVYATANDLKIYSPQIEQLQDGTTDQGNFAEQRHQARAWYDDEVVKRYYPVAGRSQRALNAARTGSGPFAGYGDPPVAGEVPTDSELRAILAADGLVVTDDIKKCVSHKAASIVYLSQPTNAYAQLGEYHANQAAVLFFRCVHEVKSTPELTAPDLRIDRDVTFLT